MKTIYLIEYQYYCLIKVLLLLASDIIFQKSKYIGKCQKTTYSQVQLKFMVICKRNDKLKTELKLIIAHSLYVICNIIN